MSYFDPSYGYTLKQLECIAPPAEPEDFVSFWQARYRESLSLVPQPRLECIRSSHPDFDCYDLVYCSTDAFEIWGWLLIPRHVPVTRGFIVGHGYGGRQGPDFDLPIPNAVFLFPCFRGLSRSQRWPISENPTYHVLHDIDKKDRYILGGCVEDLWVAVSALLALYPGIEGHVGYLGISFGGGIGALALPWDRRIRRAHFNVPSFGHQPLRLQLPTWGSAASVQNYQRDHGHVLDTLLYYDAAIAAKYIRVPVHVAAALSDPVVAPPGQFCIYNALSCEKHLFVLDQGHADYPRKTLQDNALRAELREFFSGL